MTVQVGVGIGVALLALMWLSLRGPSLSKLLQQAIATKDLTPLFEAAGQLGEKQRSFFYQQAIQQLWNGYHRVLAARVAKRLAEEFPDEMICQYWLRQVQEHEPEIAAEELDEQFLRSHYSPDVAACCGVASS